MDISVIVPAFNGGTIIRKLFLKINETLSGTYTFEVLFIFDNGKESTWQIIKELKDGYPNLRKSFRLAKNYGQHRAIQFGMGQSRGRFVITMDEDLQHNPYDILRLIEKQKENNYDIVYGKFNDLQNSEIRNRISFALRKTLKRFIPSLYDNYSPYRLIKKEIALRTSTMVCPYTFIDDYLSRLTQNIAFEDIVHHRREEGKSSYTIRRLFKHGIFILLAYSKLITLLITLSGLFFVIGLVLFGFSIFSSGSLNKVLANELYIILTFGIGMILTIFSLIGSLINHRNTIINTRHISYLSEDPI